MKTYPGLCLHTMTKILRRWQARNSTAWIVEKQCLLCDKRWTAWEDAGGEDI